MNKFSIKAYGWQELAILYSPALSPNSATKRFKKWILYNPQLYRDLQQAGFRERSKVLTPMQVEIIVRYLGEP